MDFICCQAGKSHSRHTKLGVACAMVCDPAVSVIQMFLQAMEPLADLWQIGKGDPSNENVKTLGLAMLERAVWDDTLFRAKAVDRDEMNAEAWAIFLDDVQ